MVKRHPAADGVMALVHQGQTQERNGRDTTGNARDLAQALRNSGSPKAL